MTMTQPSFVSITNQQIYDKLVTVEARVAEITPIAQTVAVDHERLRSVELELAGIKAVAKSASRYKLVAYPALAAGVGALATAIVPLVK